MSDGDTGLPGGSDEPLGNDSGSGGGTRDLLTAQQLRALLAGVAPRQSEIDSLRAQLEQSRQENARLQQQQQRAFTPLTAADLFARQAVTANAPLIDAAFIERQVDLQLLRRVLRFDQPVDGFEDPVTARDQNPQRLLVSFVADGNMSPKIMTLAPELPSPFRIGTQEALPIVPLISVLVETQRLADHRQLSADSLHGALRVVWNGHPALSQNSGSLDDFSRLVTNWFGHDAYDQLCTKIRRPIADGDLEMWLIQHIRAFSLVVAVMPLHDFLSPLRLCIAQYYLIPGHDAVHEELVAEARNGHGWSLRDILGFVNCFPHAFPSTPVQRSCAPSPNDGPDSAWSSASDGDAYCDVDADPESRCHFCDDDGHDADECPHRKRGRDDQP